MARIVPAGPDLDARCLELGDRGHLGCRFRLGDEHAGSLRHQDASGARPRDSRADHDDPLAREPPRQSRPPRAMKSA